MNCIVPSQKTEDNKPVATRKSFADTKKQISNMFWQALNKHTTNENGDQLTFLQDMVQNTVRLATDKEQDAYVNLAATKFIVEHLEGKAGSMKEETKQETPQIVICVKDTPADEIRQAIRDADRNAQPAEDVIDEISEGFDEADNSIEVKVSDEDGTNTEEYLA